MTERISIIKHIKIDKKDKGFLLYYDSVSYEDGEEKDWLTNEECYETKSSMQVALMSLLEDL